MITGSCAGSGYAGVGIEVSMGKWSGFDEDENTVLVLFLFFSSVVPLW